ncbi:MAG TPA: hypothetical protein VKO18_10270 [Terriglobia bacterium]|nr:hypothetical protein [Terriglobia bacterium]
MVTGLSWKLWQLFDGRTQFLSFNCAGIQILPVGRIASHNGTHPDLQVTRHTFFLHHKKEAIVRIASVPNGKAPADATTEAITVFIFPGGIEVRTEWFVKQVPKLFLGKFKQYALIRRVASYSDGSSPSTSVTVLVSASPHRFKFMVGLHGGGRWYKSNKPIVWPKVKPSRKMTGVLKIYKQARFGGLVFRHDRFSHDAILSAHSDVGFLTYDERFSALPECFAGNLALSVNVTRLQGSYEGIDGSCDERRPSSVFCRILGSILAIRFGLRTSYRLIVKGDDCAYLIGWKLLIPHSFFSIVLDVWLLLDCFPYFTNQCTDIDKQTPYLGRQVHGFNGNTVTVARLIPK